MSFRISNKSDLLLEYQRIAENNVSQKIAFYRRHENEIVKIHLEERMEIEKDFLMALFQNGEFRDYLTRCERLISQLFNAEIFPHFDKESLRQLLFHKAACQYNIHLYEESKQTMKALIRISSTRDVLYERLLIKIFKRQYHRSNYKARGTIIAMILFAAIISIFNVLVTDAFYPRAFELAQRGVWMVLILAIVLWVYSEEKLRLKARKAALRFMAEN